jgi:hypothetical protein
LFAIDEKLSDDITVTGGVYSWHHHLEIRYFFFEFIVTHEVRPGLVVETSLVKIETIHIIIGGEDDGLELVFNE